MMLLAVLIYVYVAATEYLPEEPYSMNDVILSRLSSFLIQWSHTLTPDPTLLQLRNPGPMH